MIHKTGFCGRKNHPFIMYLPNGMHKMMHPGVWLLIIRFNLHDPIGIDQPHEFQIQ